MNTQQAATTFAALAQETRLNVLRMLVEAGPEGLSAGVISTRMAMAHNSMSFHLGQLKTAGLVDSYKQGRSMIYRASFAQITGLVQFLLEDCCVSSTTGCDLPCDTTAAHSETSADQKPRLKFAWSTTS